MLQLNKIKPKSIHIPVMDQKLSQSPQYRNHFVYALSQWETTLQCNVVTHWLGAFTYSSCPWAIDVYCEHYGEKLPYCERTCLYYICYRNIIGKPASDWTLFALLSSRKETIWIFHQPNWAHGYYTEQCHYDTVNFLPNPHDRHPIAHLWGWYMGCL